MVTCWDAGVKPVRWRWCRNFVRGVGPLLNLDAFHQAFGTRPGDAMWRAPQERVRIW
jgi:hypothetical protein